MSRELRMLDSYFRDVGVQQDMIILRLNFIGILLKVYQFLKYRIGNLSFEYIF